ncbi:Putative uncharacterized protein [Moritella viscosa]|uniref:tyrosine-type recombinase/integrase n=1 Tax=Moritella viscosa TaxID=80854 RepID=UPI000912A18B|nr:tyrosine-type recombinase/integrase [Moritella viscosa]SGY83621.1 Putative uncharacterized protein [Moritella viscosa]
MKINDIKNHDQSAIPVLDKNIVVTRTSTGEPRSYIYDESWDYSGEKNIAMDKVAKVTFTSIKNLDNRRKIQETMFRITLSDSELSISRLTCIVSNLNNVSKILGHTDWFKLSDNTEWKRLKNGLKGRYVSGTLEGYHSALNKLVSTGYMARYIEPNEFRSLAREDGETQQHIAIPTDFYQKILTRCIKTIEDYHPYRHEISNVMAEAHKIKSEAYNCVQPLSPKKGCKDPNKSIKEAATRKVKLGLAHNIPGFKFDFTGGWINDILTECLMVCALFSGARLGEILSFNKDSYTTKNTINGKVSVVQGLTTKGNGGDARTETWQCHSIVKDALELAHDMTEFARNIYKEQVKQLFDSASITEDEHNRGLEMLELSFISPRVTKNCNLSYILPAASTKTNKFLNRIGLKATIEDVEEFDLLNETRFGQLKLGGTLPKLSPHDFRRSFAVFMKRHGLGNAQTIKFQYKHENIQMSEYYANNAHLAHMQDILLDEELISFMEEEGIRMGVDAYDEIFNKSNHLSGIEGERILNDKFEAMKSGQSVYMNRSEIDGLVRNGSLSLVMLPTGGYCTNTSCERLCGIKEFVAEKTICQYQIVTDIAAKKQAKYRDRLIKKFNVLNNGDEAMNHILSGFKQSILMTESTLSSHKIPYEPFIAKIEGCYVS